MSKKYQEGFTVLEYLIVLLVVLVVGVAGYAVWSKSNSANKTQVSKQQPSSSTTVSTLTEVSEKSLESQKFNAPKCGTTEAANLSAAKLDMSYTPPSGWAVSDMTANSKTHLSPDFNETTNQELGRKEISEGSRLTVYVERGCTSGKNLVEDMKTKVTNGMFDTDVKLSYFRIGSYAGVRFNTNSGESHNSKSIAFLFKNDQVYTLEQAYAYNTTSNPYPDTLNKVLSSVK